MVVRRQVFRYLVVLDVVLFLIASAFNDQSTTSLDGVVWWIALLVFLLLIVAASVILIQFLISRGKRPRRTPTR